MQSVYSFLGRGVPLSGQGLDNWKPLHDWRSVGQAPLATPNYDVNTESGMFRLYHFVIWDFRSEKKTSLTFEKRYSPSVVLTVK
jgi:hypothetical protein